MRNEKKKKRIPMKTIALRALAGAGMVSVAVMAPNMARLMKDFDKGKLQKDRLYERTRKSIALLKKNGLIRTSGAYKTLRVELTQKGRQMAEEAEFEQYQIPEPAFWDGKWRVVIFDMSEKRRKTRDRLRALLVNAEFIRIQDSVWVYPYPCDEFLALVHAHLKIGVGEMRAFTADVLESDRSLREHFRLV
jgi:DNA-binding transcriptional regulator PaaX